MFKVVSQLREREIPGPFANTKNIADNSYMYGYD